MRGRAPVQRARGGVAGGVAGIGQTSAVLAPRVVVTLGRHDNDGRSSHPRGCHVLERVPQPWCRTSHPHKNGHWLSVVSELLLERLGPFRLGYLEALLRAADCRASQEEDERGRRLR